MGWNCAPLAEVKGPDGKWHLIADPDSQRLLELAFDRRVRPFWARLGFVMQNAGKEPIADRNELPNDTSDAARATGQGQDIFETREWCAYSDPNWFMLPELLDDPCVMADAGDYLIQFCARIENPAAVRILLAWCR